MRNLIRGRSRLSLLLDTHQAVAELVAECLNCGAMTTQILELAWRARAIVCGDCLTSVRIDGDVLQGLRRQAVEATEAIDRLTGAGSAPANE